MKKYKINLYFVSQFGPFCTGSLFGDRLRFHVDGTNEACYQTIIKVDFFNGEFIETSSKEFRRSCFSRDREKMDIFDREGGFERIPFGTITISAKSPKLALKTLLENNGFIYNDV